MNLVESSQFSYGQIVAGAIGATMLGLFLAMLLGGALHAVLHALGAWRTRMGAPKKFVWWVALVGVGLCVVMGGVTGLKIGVVRAAVPVARDLGPKMLDEGLQQALRGAGLTNFTQLDVKQLRELVEKAETVALPPFNFHYAERVRSEIEAARARLVPAVKGLIEGRSKQGKLALSELVSPLWPLVFAELTAWERHFRRWEIITGVAWVVGIELALALTCYVMRQTRKPYSPKPPNLPKPESWQPKRS